MSKPSTLAQLHEKHAFIYLDAKKSKHFPYLSGEYEPSLEGFVLKKTDVGILVRVFHHGEASENQFYKSLSEVQDPTTQIINNLLIEHTQRLFIPWTSIVAIEV
jgi:hypothetical protein